MTRNSATMLPGMTTHRGMTFPLEVIHQNVAAAESEIGIVEIGTTIGTAVIAVVIVREAADHASVMLHLLRALLPLHYLL